MRIKDRNAVEGQLDAAAQACVQDGVRLTKLRRHVMRLLLEAEGPSTAYQLLDRLKETHKGAAPTSIYRALDFLLAQRLIHKVERLSAFVPCVEAGHDQHPAQFLICRQCGAVVEIGDQAVSKALAHAAEREGFYPGDAVVELDGTCAACSHAN
jgi:Fur family transcriptional regulator, zinc uptake regulator